MERWRVGHLAYGVLLCQLSLCSQSAYFHGGDARLTKFPDPQLQHLVLSSQILGLGLVECALVPASRGAGQHLVNFVWGAWEGAQSR